MRGTQVDASYAPLALAPVQRNPSAGSRAFRLSCAVLPLGQACSESRIDNYASRQTGFALEGVPRMNLWPGNYPPTCEGQIGQCECGIAALNAECVRAPLDLPVPCPGSCPCTVLIVYVTVSGFSGVCPNDMPPTPPPFQCSVFDGTHTLTRTDASCSWDDGGLALPGKEWWVQLQCSGGHWIIGFLTSAGTCSWWRKKNVDNAPAEGAYEYGGYEFGNCSSDGVSVSLSRT